MDSITSPVIAEFMRNYTMARYGWLQLAQRVKDICEARLSELEDGKVQAILTCPAKAPALTTVRMIPMNGFWRMKSRIRVTLIRGPEPMWSVSQAMWPGITVCDFDRSMLERTMTAATLLRFRLYPSWSTLGQK